ncbi:MAG: HEPN domain-containing protein [Myxococcales bacterium]|nr:HEPN domain-containing protein [Myxococcales bacterium]
MSGEFVDPARVVALLEDAEDDLRMAEFGAKTQNRHAAFHLQQAAEKLVRAVRLTVGLDSTKQHDIGRLLEGDGAFPPLPPDHPLCAELKSLDVLTQYATTYRYPTPTGKRKPGPGAEQIGAFVARLRDLAARARALV